AQPNITAPIAPIVATLDAEFTPIGNFHTRVYLRSDKDAPNRRIIAIDLENTDRSAWKVVVAEQPHAIENAVLVGGRIVVHSLVDVQSRIHVFALDGAHEREVPLPGIGAVTDLYGRADQYDVWFTFSSPLAPPTVYRYDLQGRTRMTFEAPRPPIDASRFETHAMFAISKDGTRVPFFMTSRKGLRRDGHNPTMLYG